MSLEQDWPRCDREKVLVNHGETHYHHIHGTQHPYVPIPPQVAVLLETEDSAMLEGMSFEQVLVQYEGMLYWQVWNTIQSGPFVEEDQADLMQIARLAAWEAWRKFDKDKVGPSGKKCKFSSYLTVCLWTFLDDAKRKAYKNANRIVLKDPVVMEFHVDPEVHDDFLFDDVRKLLSDEAIAVFNCMVFPTPDLETEACREFVPHVTRKAVSNRLGMSPMRVSEAVGEIKQAIQMVLYGTRSR